MTYEILVHLVTFIIRIYHEARSSECQIIKVFKFKTLLNGIVYLKVLNVFVFRWNKTFYFEY